MKNFTKQAIQFKSAKDAIQFAFEEMAQKRNAEYDRYGLECWAVRWISENKLDGRREHFCFRGEPYGPAIFRTRAEAREWRDLHYGYIRDRPDLKREPHGWRLPRVERVIIFIFEPDWGGSDAH